MSMVQLSYPIPPSQGSLMLALVIALGTLMGIVYYLIRILLLDREIRHLKRQISAERQELADLYAKVKGLKNHPGYRKHPN